MKTVMLVYYDNESEDKATKVKEDLEAAGNISAILIPEGVSMETVAVIDEETK